MSHRINFADSIKALQSQQVWEYETGSRAACKDVAQATFTALQRPADFPPIEAAIVPGDRVALAVDPNAPNVADVVLGALRAVKSTEAGEVDVILWDEATDETVAAVRQVVGNLAETFRHSPTDRAALRYLGADEFADPIYLNRRLVDADFVLPIVAARPMDTLGGQDLTGIFPAFADSISRKRFLDSQTPGSDTSTRKGTASDPTLEPAWLLGVQIMISVVSRNRGDAGQVLAGTTESIRKQLKPTRRLPDEFPPAAPLVIASVDGDQQQQTWSNAARAVAAASRFAQDEGTIVLWSAISEPPSNRLLALMENAESKPEPAEEVAERGDDEDFPVWDETVNVARTLARVALENRLLIHSQIDSEWIEGMGLGSVNSSDELTRLSQSFEACGVLRAAQFEGTTRDI